MVMTPNQVTENREEVHRLARKIVKNIQDILGLIDRPLFRVTMEDNPEHWETLLKSFEDRLAFLAQTKEQLVIAACKIANSDDDVTAPQLRAYVEEAGKPYGDWLDDQLGPGGEELVIRVGSFDPVD